MSLFLNEISNLSRNSVSAINDLINRGIDSIEQTQRQISFTEGMISDLTSLGKEAAAKPYFDQLEVLRKKIASEVYFIGQCRTHFGDNQGANDLFMRALELDGDFENAAIALGRGYLEVGKYREAVDVLTEAEQRHSPGPRLSLFLGCSYFYLRKMDAAQKNLERALNEMPGSQLISDSCYADELEIWRRVAITSVRYLRHIAGWRQAVETVGMSERDIQRLNRIADGRPIYLTAIEGSGWVLSHMVSQIEGFVRQLWLDGVRNPFVIVINPYEFCNPPLVHMYQRAVWMVDDRFPRLRRRLIAARELLKQQKSPLVPDIDRFNPRPHVYNQFAHHMKGWLEAPQTISFSEEEEERGKAIIRDIGLPQEAEYVCFAVRESNYYRSISSARSRYAFYWEAGVAGAKAESSMRDELGAEGDRNSELSSVEQKMSPLRTPLGNYLEMAKECEADGLYFLRMGANVNERILAELGPRIIDYASDFRSEFGDVYIFANSKFVIAGGTGVMWINAAFGRPAIVTDLYVPNTAIFNTCRNGIPNLYLPRKYWLIEEKRFLSLSESYRVCRYYQHAHNCAADGVENVPNSPQELIDVVDEMNNRIDGVWVDDEESEELQNRCRALLQPYEEGFGLNGRIGTGFLRSNLDILM